VFLLAVFIVFFCWENVLFVVLLFYHVFQSLAHPVVHYKECVSCCLFLPSICTGIMQGLSSFGCAVSHDHAIKPKRSSYMSKQQISESLNAHNLCFNYDSLCETGCWMLRIPVCVHITWYAVFNHFPVVIFVGCQIRSICYDSTVLFCRSTWLKWVLYFLCFVRALMSLL